VGSLARDRSAERATVDALVAERVPAEGSSAGRTATGAVSALACTRAIRARAGAGAGAAGSAAPAAAASRAAGRRRSILLSQPPPAAGGAVGAGGDDVWTGGAGAGGGGTATVWTTGRAARTGARRSTGTRCGAPSGERATSGADGAEAGGALAAAGPEAAACTLAGDGPEAATGAVAPDGGATAPVTGGAAAPAPAAADHPADPEGAGRSVPMAASAGVRATREGPWEAAAAAAPGAAGPNWSRPSTMRAPRPTSGAARLSRESRRSPAGAGVIPAVPAHGSPVATAVDWSPNSHSAPQSLIPGSTVLSVADGVHSPGPPVSATDGDIASPGRRAAASAGLRATSRTGASRVAP